jgi:hypothetical protein
MFLIWVGEIVTIAGHDCAPCGVLPRDSANAVDTSPSCRRLGGIDPRPFGLLARLYTSNVTRHLLLADGQPVYGFATDRQEPARGIQQECKGAGSVVACSQSEAVMINPD